MSRAFRHDEHPVISQRLIPRAELEHVAGKALDRSVADLDVLPPGGAQMLDHPPAIGRNDRFGSDDHGLLANAHEDVGVIERYAAAIDGAEEDRLVAQLLRPFLHHLRMST